jgi:hypothetical protein
MSVSLLYDFVHPQVPESSRTRACWIIVWIAFAYALTCQIAQAQRCSCLRQIGYTAFCGIHFFVHEAAYCSSVARSAVKRVRVPTALQLHGLVSCVVKQHDDAAQGITGYLVFCLVVLSGICGEGLACVLAWPSSRLRTYFSFMLVASELLVLASKARQARVCGSVRKGGQTSCCPALQHTQTTCLAVLALDASWCSAGAGQQTAPVTTANHQPLHGGSQTR